MSVRKRYKDDGSYVWEFCITIQKSPRKQYRRSGFKTKIDAQNAEHDALREIANGIHIDKRNMTFMQLANLYFKKIQNKSKSINRNYRNSLYNHLGYFHEMNINDINSLMVDDWINESGKTASTIKECIKFCKAIYNYGIKHDLVIKNPFMFAEVPKVISKERKRLCLDEALGLLKLCRERYPDFYPMLATQIFTGVRMGELLALKWSDIDYKTNRIKIRRQYTQGDLKESLKTSSSYRDVDICPTLLRILEEYRVKRGIISEYMFINGAGKLHNSRNLIQRRFEPLLEEMFGNRKYMRFYDLRGTYVDILLSQGVPLKYIQKQVGHSNFQTTMNNYSKLVRDVNEKAVEILEKTVSIL